VVDSLEIPEEHYIKIFDGKTNDQVLPYIREHNNIIVEVKIKLVAVKNYD
jgi:hypothetical protein